jgi:hypothetical protein
VGVSSPFAGADCQPDLRSVREELQRQVSAFDVFLEDFSARLGELADQARLASERADMTVELDVAADLDAFATAAGEDAQTRIELEEAGMNRLLSTFVSEEVEDRIAAARAAVAAELGRGTAVRQTGQVNVFTLKFASCSAQRSKIISRPGTPSSPPTSGQGLTRFPKKL